MEEKGWDRGGNGFLICLSPKVRTFLLFVVVTISQRPSEEEAEVGSTRNEEMEEEKGGPGAGLRSYI